MKKLLKKWAAVRERIRLFFRRNQDKIDYVDGILFSNPILINGMAIAPAVVATQSLQAGVILSVGFAVIVIPTVMLLFVLYDKVSETRRTILSALIASVVFAGLAYAMREVMPYTSSVVGLYLPILVVDPIILSKTEEFWELGAGKLRLLVELVFHSLGFALVVCLVGLLREMLAYGTIWGIPVSLNMAKSTVALPFFGFMLLAVLAACVRFLTRKFYHWINKKGEEEINHG